MGILADHEDREVRDVLFHPSRKLLFTCGDGMSILLVFAVTAYERWQMGGSTCTASKPGCLRSLFSNTRTPDSNDDRPARCEGTPLEQRSPGLP